MMAASIFSLAAERLQSSTYHRQTGADVATAASPLAARQRKLPLRPRQEQGVSQQDWR